MEGFQFRALRTAHHPAIRFVLAAHPDGGVSEKTKLCNYIGDTNHTRSMVTYSMYVVVVTVVTGGHLSM